MSDETKHDSHNSVARENLASEHEVRKAKVASLTSNGSNAWPTAHTVDHTTQEVRDQFTASESPDQVFSCAGRLMSLRGHGKSIFAHLQDRKGRIQIYIKQGVIDDASFDLVKNTIDVGDIIAIAGTVFRTKVGEITIRVTALKLLSKCLHPLPEKHHGLTDTEQRYRQRYLDIISNEESRKKFVMRSQIVQEVRHQLLLKDFLEVETPMLHPIPGGAAARPFSTKHNAYDMELFLRIAPELYLKRLVVGGLERVFEINRNFRNEGVSTRHNPEFTMVEFYMAHGDYIAGMALTEKIFHAAAHVAHGTAKVQYGDYLIDFESSFARYSLYESLIAVGNFSPEQVSADQIERTLESVGILDVSKLSYGEKLLLLFEESVEHKLIQPTFITDYPVEVSPLAKRHEHDETITARFELFVAGMELANGFSELNNPFDQAERFQAQAASREAGDDEAHFFDADYIKALEYGLPPTVGVGIGIDRLVMLMTNTQSIKDVILFPTMKHKS